MIRALPISTRTDPPCPYTTLFRSLGETYYGRGNYQQAAVTFAEGFETYPDNSKAPDNLLKLGMSLASLGSTQDACGTFTVLLDRYADAPATILSRAQRESQRLARSEEHTSELQSLMRISYAVFCLKKKQYKTTCTHET